MDIGLLDRLDFKPPLGEGITGFTISSPDGTRIWRNFAIAPNQLIIILYHSTASDR